MIGSIDFLEFIMNVTPIVSDCVLCICACIGRSLGREKKNERRFYTFGEIPDETVIED